MRSATSPSTGAAPVCSSNSSRGRAKKRPRSWPRTGASPSERDFRRLRDRHNHPGQDPASLHSDQHQGLLQMPREMGKAGLIELLQQAELRDSHPRVLLLPAIKHDLSNVHILDYLRLAALFWPASD